MITTLGAPDAGQRIDALVARLVGVSRAEARRLCAEGRVRLAGGRVAKGAVGVAGAILEVALPTAAEGGFVLPEVFADAWLVVVDKPAGVPSQPLRAGEVGTAAQALQDRYPEMAGIGSDPREGGLVHRLDVGTSGLLLAARDAETLQRLRSLLQAGQITKHYRALCGTPVAPGVRSGWLVARGPRVQVHDQPAPGNRAIHMEILRCDPLGPWFEVEVSVAHAGRHQVRAQLAAAGAPLVGDAVYGGPEVEGLAHHCLHASRLAFPHPVTGVYIDLASDPPWVSGALPGRSAPPPRGG